MRSVRDIPLLEKVPVLVRAALNVPVESGRVVNDYRLRRALPTARLLAERGARIVLAGHIGEKGTETLEPIARALGTLLPNVSFCDETVGKRVRDAVRALAPGHILIVENLRRHRGELLNDPVFARSLAELADVFVEDSFDTCHRAHASIIGIPKLLPSYAGLLLEEEVRELSRARTPRHPALAAIGGAKFGTKKAVLATLLETYDTVFVSGALANDFLKAAGHEVGKSLVSSEGTEEMRKILANPKLRLPIDVLVVPANATVRGNVKEKARVALIEEVQSDDIILDHGPKTAELLSRIAQKAKTILWNGPFGNYENGFTDATDRFARAIADSGARSIVGGGDTIAAIERLGLLPSFSFISTGGGAMLDFLAKGTLPGIEALESHASA